ncbi:hypothetical protein [Thiorhodococcus minor]|uniref:Uncharacterized protein n=1 Tax=Thiorhodococcus minor TaxID=57489 RepID=A0A6M0JXI6_9GAMM|nr:hypothetical protein [Thiorhodococcus minor]NEV61691.1 hypothetical protein [Thiorhodococcus minor]
MMIADSRTPLGVLTSRSTPVGLEADTPGAASDDEIVTIGDGTHRDYRPTPAGTPLSHLLQSQRLSGTLQAFKSRFFSKNKY